MPERLHLLHSRKQRKRAFISTMSAMSIIAIVIYSIVIVKEIKDTPSSHTSEEAIALTSDSCGRYFSKIEQKYGMPEHLLHAISLTESGRWLKPINGKAIWPWTLNVNGKGYYYPSKEEAIHAVRTYQKQGKKLIDVGCMQVNLHFHGDAFHHLNMALEPRYNIEYAAKYLKKHYKTTGTWRKAVGRYHSGTPLRGARYARAVYANLALITHKMDVETALNTPKATSPLAHSLEPNS